MTWVRTSTMARGALLLPILFLILSAVAHARSSEGAAPDSLAAAPGDPFLLPPLKPKPLVALGEIVGLNTALWSYNRYVRDGGKNPGFRIGFNSWAENFENGFEWDDNNFSTNQFAHPLHGSMYYNAARSNGYSFYRAAPFAFTGSFLWEHFYETHHPSFNDWVATSIGGSILGEMLYRLSDLVLKDDVHGGERFGREAAALVINPMRGFNRAINGRMSGGHDTRPYRPRYVGLHLYAGLRSVGEDHLFEADTTRFFIDLGGVYGDPFAGDRQRPFDFFDLTLQANFGDASTIGQVSTHGLLYAKPLKETDAVTHLLGTRIAFDYFNNNAFELSSQNVTAGILSRWRNTPIGEIETNLYLGAVILGGISSDYEIGSGRNYAYGPGATGYLFVGLRRNNRTWLYASQEEFWFRTLNGTDGTHLSSVTTARISLGIFRKLQVGAKYQLFLADNRYEPLYSDPDDGSDPVDLQPDTFRRYPEIRAFLSLPIY